MATSRSFAAELPASHCCGSLGALLRVEDVRVRVLTPKRRSLSRENTPDRPDHLQPPSRAERQKRAPAGASSSENRTSAAAVHKLKGWTERQALSSPSASWVPADGIFDAMAAHPSDQLPGAGASRPVPR